MASGFSARTIDIALGSTDGISRNSQPLQDSMRVGFQDRAVHEGTGVAFVSITDDVFRRAGALRQNSHLTPVGNPAPPRPRSPALLISSITCSGFIWKRTFLRD